MFQSLKGGKLPYYKVILACSLCVVFTYVISKNAHSAKSEFTEKSYVNCDERMNVVRLKNNRLTQPLLLSDTPNESSKYASLKQILLTQIAAQKAANIVNNVSVYLREFNDGSWMGIQQNEEFDPGSIMKLPILLAYLKKQELNSLSFEKNIKFEAINSSMPKQTILENTIQIGKTYKVRNLISSMIIDSDNQANMLLNQNIEPEFVFNAFTDLGLPIPKIQQSSVKMSSLDLSKFMRVLYNSSYTNQNLSEYALELLTKTKFKDGMKKGLPDSIILAHKFGERGYIDNSFQEIHETGIIYLNNNPVLLTIMTSGNNQAEQAQLIASITKICYEWLLNDSTPN